MARVSEEGTLSSATPPTTFGTGSSGVVNEEAVKPAVPTTYSYWPQETCLQSDEDDAQSRVSDGTASSVSERAARLKAHRADLAKVKMDRRVADLESRVAHEEWQDTRARSSKSSQGGHRRTPHYRLDTPVQRPSTLTPLYSNTPEQSGYSLKRVRAPEQSGCSPHRAPSPEQSG